MANITTQTIRVDLSTDKVIPSAFTHQNDTARTLEFSMYNKGVPYDMTGNTVKFAYKSPIVNGQYSVIAGASMASGTVSGNKVTVTLPSAYTAISGVGMLTMIITPTSGTVRPVNIRLVVQKSADGDDTIAGASDFPTTLQQLADEWYDENIANWLNENIESVYDAEAFGTAIDSWLDDHPEATTTVQDHSLTLDKLVIGTLGYVTPEMYGAKGDGITDDTAAIQSAIDSGAGVVNFSSKTYLVSKASNRTLFPNGDEPCVYINDKANLCINGNGATLKVANHGQGILEIIDSSNTTINDLTFEGYGLFPPISPDGRAEKGTSAGGYYKSGYDWESHKNNSVDTSAFTGVGGDATAVWGTFGNGFIGNAAIGLLIRDGSENIVINHCTSHGFNYAGFSVGFRGYSSEGINKNITFNDCVAYNMYDDGFNVLLCDGVAINRPIIYDIGHPDARPVDETTEYTYTYADPGYGVCCRKPISAYSRAKNVSVTNGNIKRCVRKGIDSHGVDGYIVQDNVVELCYVGGLELSDSKTEETYSYNVIIDSNIFRYCGAYGNALYLAVVTDGTAQITPTNVNKNVKVENNIFENCACNDFGIIFARCGYGITISNNTIAGSWAIADLSLLYAVYVGISEMKTAGAIISNNTVSISEPIAYVFFIYNCYNSVLSGNVSKTDSVRTPLVVTGTLACNVDIIGNNLFSNTVTVPPTISGIFAGKYEGNTITGATQGTKATKLQNQAITNGYFEITDSFIAVDSIVIVTPLYSASQSMTRFFVVQPKAGGANVYVRNADGTLATGEATVNVLIINNK